MQSCSHTVPAYTKQISHFIKQRNNKILYLVLDLFKDYLVIFLNSENRKYLFGKPFSEQIKTRKEHLLLN